MNYFLRKFTISSKNGEKSAKKYSKIEVIYVIKFPVCSKSIPKPRVIPKSRFYCTLNFRAIIVRPFIWHKFWKSDIKIPWHFWPRRFYNFNATIKDRIILSVLISWLTFYTKRLSLKLDIFVLFQKTCTHVELYVI